MNSQNFAEYLRELSHKHSDRRTRTGARLGSFLDDLSSHHRLTHSATRELRRRLSVDFNVFHFISPDENRLSDVIAMLLSPKGEHGQETNYLDLFVRRLGIDATPNGCPVEQGFANARVTREAPTYTLQVRRRMDILVDLPPSGAIAIENKIYAGEGEDQIADYAEHLSNVYGDRFRILYLSPSGDEPTSVPTERLRELQSNGQLLSISFAKEIASWLNLCWRHTDSEKLRFFLEDFRDYVLTRLGEGMEGVEEDVWQDGARPGH